ncbi:MAG: maleylpyruvate isomerase family mycothiol-dependent enzyme, partial [Actinomycetota bacterium]|nr:maleylpyruvate isomerase family mycothiol-dependent enzyme [Actinomycetota bacterium]
DWDMTGLVAHLGGVHRWVTGILRTGVLEKAPPPPLDNPGVVLAWYGEGLASLLEELAQTDPDALAWNWFAQEPAPARFWFRRMAHETAVHRWDAQAAAGAGPASPIDAELAVDGVDEFLGFVARWLARRPVESLSGTLHLHATDVAGVAGGGGGGGGGGEWSLTLSPHGVATRREHSKADAALRGPASDLLLWLVNRLAPDGGGLQVFGDRGILDTWRANITF